MCRPAGGRSPFIRFPTIASAALQRSQIETFFVKNNASAQHARVQCITLMWHCGRSFWEVGCLVFAHLL